MSKRIALWLAVAVLVLAIAVAVTSRCDKLPRGSFLHNLFHIVTPVPNPQIPGSGKPEVVQVPEPKPPFTVGEVSAGHGETVIYVPTTDSLTYQLIKIPTTGSGKIRVYVDPQTGQLVIDRDRIGVDLAIVAGPSIHGISGGLETFFVNDFLGVANVHALTPAAEVSLWNEDRGDVYVGVGGSIEICPRHTPIRLQGAYEWNVEDLSISRITVGLNVPLLF